jgi:hypothetical protein
VGDLKMKTENVSPPVPARGLSLPPARARVGTISLRDELRIDDGKEPSMSGRLPSRTIGGSSGGLNPLIAAQLGADSDLFDGPDPETASDLLDPPTRPPRGSRARKPGSGVLTSNGSPLHPVERKESTRKMIVPEEKEDDGFPDDFDEPDNGTAALFAAAAAAKKPPSTTTPSTVKLPETKDEKKPTIAAATMDDDDNDDWANVDDIKVGVSDSKKPNSIAAAFMDSPPSARGGTTAAAATATTAAAPPKKNAVVAAFASGGIEDWDAEIDAEEEARIKARQAEKVALHRASLGPAALAAQLAAASAAAAAAGGSSGGSLNISIAEEGEIEPFDDDDEDSFLNGGAAAAAAGGSGEEKKDTAAQLLIRKGLIAVDSDDETDPDVVASEHKLMTTLANPDRSSKKFNIVMYPEPSRMLTMKTEQGLNAYNEQQFDAWLSKLTSKHHPLFVNNGKKPEGGWDASELDSKESLATILSHVLQVYHFLPFPYHWCVCLYQRFIVSIIYR